MKNIASFTIDHNKLLPGLYISRTDGDIITYDLRFKRPNSGNYMDNAAIHTIEHLFATFVRNSDCADKIIYVGPMGCRTGFYFLVRDTLSGTKVLDLLRDTFKFIAEYEGSIPGTERSECGNYLEHSLTGAKEESSAYYNILLGCSADKLNY